MSELTVSAYLEYLARVIIEVETQHDCFGATQQHLLEMVQSADLHPQDESHFHCLIAALDKAVEEKENDIVFEVITKDVFSPEEEEAIYNGGDEK